ncbi:hypothetical protein [Tsuneonella sp. HG222]
MSSPNRSAASRFFTLLAALIVALAGHQPARAQEDPFARDPAIDARSVAAAGGPGLSEIVVDGSARSRMVELTWRGKELLIDADGARAAGLPVPDDLHGNIPLGSLEIAKWQFDTFRQRLEISLFRKSDGKNLIDLARRSTEIGESHPITALRLNYDLTASAGAGKSVVGGYLDPVLVRGNAHLQSGLQISSDNGRGRPGLKRLDTSANLYIPDKGLAVTAGDLISAGGQSQRALRLGGLKIASDFSLRPDLVTVPLPSFSGQVAVPTGIDIISNDRRTSLGEIEPGEFTVRNLPGTEGRGEVSVVLRDSIGREIIQSTRFYVSRAMLAKDISQFGANLGFVRRRYGEKSADYGPLAASAFYRRGLSPYLTLEGSGEWTRGTGNIGGRTDVIIAALVHASVEARASRDTRAGTGTLFDLAVESAGRGLSFGAGATLPSRKYRDVASRLGDFAVPKRFFGQVSFDLRDTIRANVSATRLENREDPRFPRLERRIDALNLSLRTRVRDGIDLYTNGSLRRSERGTSYALFAGLSVQLGKGRSGYASGTVTNGRQGYSGGFRKFDAEPGDIGYAIEGNLDGDIQRISGSASVRRDFGRLEVQAEQVNGQFSGRANARGTLIFVDNKVFARNQTTSSLALVRTTGNVDGVTVMRENRPAGVTSRGGVLLVEGLPNTGPTAIDVDGLKLPLDSLARATSKLIYVPRGSVGVVDLDIVRYRPVIRRVLDAGGNPLPAGMPVAAEPSGEKTMIGFDGYVEINAAGADGRLLVGKGADRCVVDLVTNPVTDDVEGPPLQCVGGAIAGLARADAVPGLP